MHIYEPEDLSNVLICHHTTVAIFLELIPVFDIPMASHLSAIVSLRLAILSFKLIKVKIYL
jgi:hypothetical protein